MPISSTIDVTAKELITLSPVLGLPDPSIICLLSASNNEQGKDVNYEEETFKLRIPRAIQKLKNAQEDVYEL